MLLSIRNFSSSVRSYLMASFLLGLAVDGILAVLFNLYLLRLGYSTEFIGVVNAVGLFGFAGGSLLAGALGSRLGSRRMLQLATLLVSLGLLLLSSAGWVPAGVQGGWLAGSYVIIFLGQASFFVNGSPFMMGSAGNADRSALFSVQTAVQSLAAFSGSFVGGFLPEMLALLLDRASDDPITYLRPIQSLILLTLLAMFLVYRTVEPRQLATRSRSDASRAWRQNWAALPLALILLISFIRLLQVAGLGAVTTFFNVYLDTELHVSTAGIGVLTSLSRVIGVPAALLVPRLSRRFGNLPVAIVGTLLSAVFLLPVALIPHWAAAGAGYIASRMMVTIRFPSFQIYVLERFEERWQSLISGSMSMAAGLSFALMALGGGYIAAGFSFRDLFLLGAAMTALSAVMLLVVQARTNRRVSRNTTGANSRN